MSGLARNTALALSARIISMVLGVGISVILARFLGPEGKGLYSLAILLPTLIVTFISLGIGPATIYHVARKDFSSQVAFGNNLLLALVLGAVGVVGGVLVSLLFGEEAFPGVPPTYLLVTLCLVPLQLVNSYLLYVLHGEQRFGRHAILTTSRSLLFLVFAVIGLVLLHRGVLSAILAVVASYIAVCIVQILQQWRTAGIISLKPSRTYISAAFKYGWKAHLATIITFLNYRLDMLLVNAYVGIAAVGLYSVGVGLVEKLWLIPNAASTALYPRISAEQDENRRKSLTPFVARSTLWLTALGATVLVLLCRPIVLLLYSSAYIKAVGAAQALLVGIVAIAGLKPLANDLSGRGKPILNSLVGLVTLITNLVLNLLMIPRAGIAGAAWASTISYSVSLVLTVFIYCRVSGNAWHDVILPKRSDVRVYANVVQGFLKNLRR